MSMDPPPSQVSPRTLCTIGGYALGFILLGWLLWKASTVVLWSLLAMLVALALAPVLRHLERLFPRRSAIAALVIGTLGLALLGFIHVAPPLLEQLVSLVGRLPHLAVSLREHTWFVWFEETALRTDVANELHRLGPTLTMPALEVLREMASALLATTTVLLLSLFMLVFAPSLLDEALQWAPPPERARYERMARNLVQKVGGYVGGTLVVAGMSGAFTGVLLLVFRVPFFLPLGLLVALFSLLPFVGSAAGMVLVGLVVLGAKGPHWAGLTLTLLFLFFQVKAHFIEPLVLRRSLSMNPLLVTEAVLVGTAVAGTFGALLALPVAGMLQVLLGEWRGSRQRRLDSSGPAGPASS